MYRMIISQLKISGCLLVLITILTGVVYPLLITGIAQSLFPKQANGSLIVQHGEIIGSQLIGQSFSDPRYFWGRPSATKPHPYNAQRSSGSNMGALNLNFLSTIQDRVAQVNVNNQLVPVDLITSSASGLDPEISPVAAYYQVSRISKMRQISENELQKLIQSLVKPRALGILGEPRVNVLELNLALDKLKQSP